MNLKQAFNNMPEHARAAYAEKDKKGELLSKQIQENYSKIEINYTYKMPYVRVLANVLLGKIEVRVYNSYDIREELKSAGFHYDSNYYWYRRSDEIETIKKITDSISSIAEKIGWF